MEKQKESSPLSIGTKIPIYWLIAVAVTLGFLFGGAQLSQSAYKEKTDMKIAAIDKTISSIAGDLSALHKIMSKSCVEMAVLKNDQKHIIFLLEDLKQEMKGLTK